MFANNKEQYGYDAIFMEDIREELKCVICQMVLRDAVQIMSCGHRFCSPCFQRIKEHSQQLNVELVCPVDRDVISLSEVFQDRGITRTIGNLKVKCGNFERGCTWVNDLRELETHKDVCEHRIVEDAIQSRLHHGNEGDSDALMKELLQRVQKCEENLLSKEKDLIQLKFSLKELKEDSNKKEKEIELLKLSNTELQKEMKYSNELKQEIKTQFKNETQMLKNKNNEIETKVNAVEAGLLETKLSLEDGNKELIRNMIEMNNVCIDNKIAIFHKEIGSVKYKIDQKQLSLDDNIGKLRTQLSKIEKETRSTRSHLDKSLNKKKSEIDALTEWSIDIEGRIEEYSEHIENIENVIYALNSFAVDQTIEFKWVLENYKNHFDLGIGVLSPVFYTEVIGYCLQLKVGWKGEKKENLGVFLKLHRAKSETKTLKPFSIEYTLKIHRNNGSTRSAKMTHGDLVKFRDEYFIIHQGEDVARGGSYGFPKMLTAPYQDYVINDSLFISCIIHL